MLRFECDFSDCSKRFQANVPGDKVLHGHASFSLLVDSCGKFFILILIAFSCVAKASSCGLSSWKIKTSAESPS